MAETKQCAYCAAPTDKLEYDHVPPRSIFAQPRPALITVPACPACHRPTTKDDEYFRLVLSMRRDVHDHADVSGGVLDSVLRSLTYPQAERFSQSFLNTVREVAVKTPGGSVSRQRTYEASRERVFRVVERTVRGLFFHHTREPLGPNYGVRVIEDSFVDWCAMSADQVERIRNLANALARTEAAKIGDAFEYARLCAPEDARVSGWLLKFYGKIVFLAITGPKRGTRGWRRSPRNPR